MIRPYHFRVVGGTQFPEIKSATVIVSHELNKIEESGKRGVLHWQQMANPHLFHFSDKFRAGNLRHQQRRVGSSKKD